MQQPEILLFFSGPVELLPVQIPLPAIRVFCLPVLVANCQAHHGPWCLGWGGFCAHLSAGSLPRGGGHAWSHLRYHVALAMGSWKASESPQFSPLLPGS